MSKSKTKSKKSASKTSDPLTKKALATIDANIARIDGEALAETSRANKRKAASKSGEKLKAANAGRAKRPSGLDLAAKVLVEAKEPLDAKTIADRTIKAGWKTSGKTPHATIYAAIIREISEKGKDARFKKVDRGMFAAGTQAKEVK